MARELRGAEERCQTTNGRQGDRPHVPRRVEIGWRRVLEVNTASTKAAREIPATIKTTAATRLPAPAALR